MTRSLHSPRRLFSLAALLGTIWCTSLPAAADVAADQTAVRAVLMQTWDQPQARLRADPVVVRGNHAIADWMQGERGGRALLARTANGQWIVTLCAGDGLKDPALLHDAGIPSADVHALLQALAAAEKPLSQAELAQLASFEGLVRMDAQGNHPPAHHTGHHDTHGQHAH
ncbi:MAG: hypothetical protein RLY71_3965 [Pseudomonadota bacterium]|jgi:hypothetical protein